MQKINGLLQEMDTRLTWASSKCFQHKNYPEGFGKIIINGLEKCPLCERDRLNKELEVEIAKDAFEIKQRGKYNILLQKSILQDEEIVEARFENYRVEGEHEALENRNKMYSFAKDILNGRVFNVLLYGSPGVGKSHLSYSLLHYVNEQSDFNKSCLFIDLDEMLRKIRESFNNSETPYTEMYFNKLLSEVDVLVLDDLGAETGNEQTEKRASDFTGRILRAVANSRQKKVTIVTTNLGGTQLNKMYDGKTLSRLSKNREVVIFKETIDKRPLGF